MVQEKLNDEFIIISGVRPGFSNVNIYNVIFQKIFCKSKYNQMHEGIVQSRH